MTTLEDAARNMREAIGGNELVAAITFVTLAQTGDIDPTTAAEHAELFPLWTGNNYKKSTIVLYEPDGLLYQARENIPAGQEIHTPPSAPTLWKKYVDPAEEWPAWSQPLGSLDAYELGAKVSHHGKHWLCTAVDGGGKNTWEPGVYGWTEQV